MPRREFLMLAKVYDAQKHSIAGWYASEKLDGVRCFWDGGITRDKPTAKIPWAGLLDPKTGQMKTKIKPKATGLWSRYGNPIQAPEWFLNTLPSCPLDGELYAGRGQFQKTCSIVRKDKPDEMAWEGVKFAVFSTPSLPAIFADGEIKSQHQITSINHQQVQAWLDRQQSIEGWVCLMSPTGVAFSVELATLTEWIDEASDTVFLVHQTKLPANEDRAKEEVTRMMRGVLANGGEGLILRHPDSIWTPKRVLTMLKVKGAVDDEGIVTGFTSGRKTTRGSKLLGRIGALILDYKGERLELAGLTDEERAFSSMDETKFALENPGIDMPKSFQGKHFKVGDMVTFTYRELSKDGIPKEARYLRKRNVGD